MIFDNLYNYYLPYELIAQTPSVPRDFSKLFVYNTKTGEIVFDRFYNLDKYLPTNSFLVLNNSRVLPARVELKKESGGKVVALLLLNEYIGRTIRMMVDRKVKVGERLFIDKNHSFQVVDQQEKIFYLNFNFDRQWLIKKLIKIGKTPVPLYLRKTPLLEEELRKKYQTVFSQNFSFTSDRCSLGSVAAPTASLHFTKRVFKSLDNKGIKKFFITLHVGLGTFAPVTEDNFQQKKLHREYFKIDQDSLQCFKTLKLEGCQLVAVGTTVTRTLESIAQSKILDLRSKIFDKTDLFIFPPFKFKMVDCLITNFHLPRSSLMMLVEAFLQFKRARRHLIDLYQMAIKEKFQFYSFGDAMLVV